MGFACSALRACPVQFAVDLLVIDDRLYVLAGFRERDRLDEFVHVAIMADGLPIDYALVSRVIGGEGVSRVTAELVQRLLQVERTQADVVEGSAAGWYQSDESPLPCHALAHARQQLHESICAFVGDRARIELGLVDVFERRPRVGIEPGFADALLDVDQ